MAAGRASETTRERLALSLVVLALAAACREPAGADSASSSSSSSDDGASATTEQPLPGRVPPEPFVLPEGCGDGVPVSGQYDCHYPVSLEYLKEAMGASQDPLAFRAWDMDGDGRDELLAFAPGFSPTPKLVAPLRWNGERFDVGRPAGGEVDMPHWTSRFDVDINGDGRPDLVKNDHTRIAYHLVTPSFELEDEQVPARFNLPIWGEAVPIDVDADGQLEALAVRWPFSDKDPYPPLHLWLHENVDGIWTPIGQALDLPGCDWPHVLAWADFNEDGHQDVAILHHPSGCDPFPLEYDPAWHSVAVFFKEPLTQTLVPGPVIPAGGITSGELLIVDDFDGDGHLDFLLGLGAWQHQSTTGAAIIRGRGEGSFEEGVPIELPGIAEWSLRGRGDLDGDGDLDWIVRGDTVVDDIFAMEPDIVIVRSDAMGRDGEPWSNIRTMGDFNGDGVIDYIGLKRNNNGKYERIAMISAP
jgi:hypothetical protein